MGGARKPEVAFRVVPCDLGSFPSSLEFRMRMAVTHEGFSCEIFMEQSMNEVWGSAEGECLVFVSYQEAGLQEVACTVLLPSSCVCSRWWGGCGVGGCRDCQEAAGSFRMINSVPGGPSLAVREPDH